MDFVNLEPFCQKYKFTGWKVSLIFGVPYRIVFMFLYKTTFPSHLARGERSSLARSPASGDRRGATALTIKLKTEKIL